MNRLLLVLIVAVLCSACQETASTTLKDAEDIIVKTTPVKSLSVDSLIRVVSTKIKTPKLQKMFAQCFPNTLATTVDMYEENGKEYTFVITGDIPAMWLRDATAQVWPYLPLSKSDQVLRRVIRGVINQDIKNLLIDPYANAFNKEPIGSYWESDITDMKKELHERKWEVDGACYVVRLSYGYWQTTSDVSCFDEDWLKAMKLVVQTFKQQQRKEVRGPYTFKRIAEHASDNVVGDGYGNPVKPTGMIVSIFRPSDDATIFPYLVPSNYFAVVSLKQLAQMADEIYSDQQFAKICLELAREVEKGLQQYAIHDHPTKGEILAFEVDGYGGRVFMDDANIPSLLSLPYLSAIDVNSALYKNTRSFVLSLENPYFKQGDFPVEGVGSPHVKRPNIWPMSIIMRALTSHDDQEITNCIQALLLSDAGTNFMHESFVPDNPTYFSRSWFAWANTLFGEMIVKVANERPSILEFDFKTH